MNTKQKTVEDDICGFKNLIITPNHKTTSIDDHVMNALTKIRNAFSIEPNDQEYYHVVIEGEYSREVCDVIGRIYKKAGWGHVVCKISSENEGRGGLTGLELWRELPIPEWDKEIVDSKGDDIPERD